MEQRQVISARVVHFGAPGPAALVPPMARRDGAAGRAGGSRVVRLERVR
jgi:hypothetical protein